jgi:hypothetical protein
MSLKEASRLPPKHAENIGPVRYEPLGPPALASAAGSAGAETIVSYYCLPRNKLEINKPAPRGGLICRIAASARQTVLWTKQAILSMGMSQAEPTQPANCRRSPPEAIGEPGQPQELPKARRAPPMLVTTLQKQGWTNNMTPVKPQTDWPPQVQYIVTVSPTKSADVRRNSCVCVGHRITPMIFWAVGAQAAGPR